MEIYAPKEFVSNAGSCAHITQDCSGKVLALREAFRGFGVALTYNKSM